MDALWGIVIRIAGTSSGVVLIYASLFLHEDEEGKLQNRLEEWWIRIDDLRRSSQSTVSAFIIGTAQLVRALLDSLFGSSIWSLRAVSVSALLSLSSFGITLFPFREALLPAVLNAIPMPAMEPPYPEKVVQAVVHLWILLVSGIFIAAPLSGLRHVGMALGVLALAAALVPTFYPRWQRAPLYLCATALVFLLVFALLPGLYRPEVLKEWVGIPEMLVVTLIAGIGMDAAFIAMIRWTFKPDVALDAPGRIVLFALAQFVSGLILLVGPLVMGFVAMHKGPAVWVGFSIIFSMLTNLYSIIIASGFFLIAAVLLIHRLAWPLIERPLYSVQRLRVFEDRKARLVVLGLGAMLLCITWRWLEALRLLKEALAVLR